MVNSKRNIEFASTISLTGRRNHVDNRLIAKIRKKVMTSASSGFWYVPSGLRGRLSPPRLMNRLFTKKNQTVRYRGSNRSTKGTSKKSISLDHLDRAVNDIGMLGVKVRYLILLLYIVLGVFEVLILGTDFRFSFTSAIFGAASLGYGVKIGAEGLANEILKAQEPMPPEK